MGQPIFSIFLRHKLPADGIILAQVLHNFITRVDCIALQGHTLIHVYHGHLNAVGVAIRIPARHNIYPGVQRRQHQQSHRNQQGHWIMQNIFKIPFVNPQNILPLGFFCLRLFLRISHSYNPPSSCLHLILQRHSL